MSALAAAARNADATAGCCRDSLSSQAGCTTESVPPLAQSAAEAITAANAHPRRLMNVPFSFSLLPLSTPSAQYQPAVGADIRPSLRRAIRPLNNHGGDRCPGAEAKLHPHVVRGEITSVGPNTPPESRRSLALEADAGSEPESIARPLLERDLQPAI